MKRPKKWYPYVMCNTFDTAAYMQSCNTSLYQRGSNQGKRSDNTHLNSVELIIGLGLQSLSCMLIYINDSVLMMMMMRRTQIDEHQNHKSAFLSQLKLLSDYQSHRPKYSATLNWSTFQEGNLCFKKGHKKMDRLQHKSVQHDCNIKCRQCYMYDHFVTSSWYWSQVAKRIENTGSHPHLAPPFPPPHKTFQRQDK